MPSSNKDSACKRDSDNNDTAADEELARELQDQFRRELEQYASESTWNEIHNIFTPGSDRSSGNGAPSRTNRADTDNIPIVDGILEDCNSSHNDTNNVANTPPTKKRISRQDQSFSTQSTSPATSLDEAPLESFSVDKFIEVAIDLEREEELARQQRKDEELARRLEKEMRDDALAQQLCVGNTFDSTTVMQEESDEELARRLQRESQEEEERRLRGLPADRTCKQKIIYYGVRITSVVLVVGVTYLVVIGMFGRNANSGLDPASWVPGWPEGDPSHGSVGENSAWDTNGKYSGLTLQVLNNLDESSDWIQYFQTALSDWDNGTPDAVNLYLRTTSYDPDCRAVRKAMKVCNGNYGPTDWRGINQILLQDDFIITSLAKMNDYYLEGTNMAQKQYTMCHEMGHGLGLGHTDENFYNRDLGNCMDYTERPQNNMHPDESNFKTLEQLYGNVDGTSVRPSNRRIAERQTAPTLADDRLTDDEFEIYSNFLSEPMQVGDEVSNSDGYRVLRKSESIEYHVRDLGNGYSIRTSVLLAI
eukprot:CCRYP_016040-RA/>CCRYP_016040-RA protein AED:0.20 eAED:0.20 QI:569/1/1/1/1/1/4/251/533